MAAYADKFSELGVKLLGLSADDVESHNAWIKDIEAYCNGCKVTDPIAADPERRIIKELNMVDPDEKDSSGNQVPSRALHIVGRNMEEVVRVAESLQRAAKGEAVVISPSVSNEEANRMFPQGYKTADVPSNKGYLRSGADPEKIASKGSTRA
ncbi:hypothetical protein SASPL_112512 [Salvia splendens]|uniref:Alkyl hydroperoxide reductase subunit C/ Thiol specific antioxidant domain-containing protein n=1 Tax=Salvia splendens TaxID=180675 RepID=A0A8X9A5C6_SALSN|nr:1-Cys peroxiredoxin-like [Salvia splendens]XP_042055188.1 1-Cys peroxiredoxin-like [Salvia splendens]KAG6428261.1 hypothetical protein SASPL_112512 [Salvia splendens]